MSRITTIVLALTLCVFASADVLTTRSGRTISGTIVEENEQSVTFLARSPGVSMREVFKRSEILSITRPKEIVGPSYFEVPIMGMVGGEISAKAIADALAAAREAKAGYVVLLFDSPGGLISECNEIIEVMDQNRDLNTVAFVKNAQSAAAVIAVTCKTIVMHPAGQIGAAVPFKFLPDGTPADINEKMASAFRRARTAAEIGGHDAKLLMGMIDTQIELYLITSKARTSVSEQKSANAALIKAKDKILTLTAEEATKYGLAKGIARTMPQVANIFGIEQWTSCGQDGREIMRSYAQAQRASYTQAVQAQQEKKSQAAIEQLKAKMREAEAQVEKYQSDIENLDKDFKDNTRTLPPTGSAYKSYAESYQNARHNLVQEKAKWMAVIDASKKLMQQMAE